jgi:hypothetical protein
MEVLPGWGHSGQWYSDPKEKMKKTDQSSLRCDAVSTAVRCRYLAWVVISSQELAPADSPHPVALRVSGRGFILDIRISPMSRVLASDFRLPCVQLNFWAQPPS